MIYVDPLRDYGWRLGPSCHLFADTLEELHAFARRLRMKRTWFQDRPGFPHYDLTRGRRGVAVELGALEVDHQFVIDRIHARNVVDRIPAGQTVPKA